MALKEQLEIGLRLANNKLCFLLGIPPRDLTPELGPGPIPTAPPEAAIGIPADLLRRRPDVRRAERQVAAQSARIGVATSDLYPHISVVGTLGYQSQNFAQLFSPGSAIGSIGPNVRWDILNYGRLLNAIRVEDARFQGAALVYQNTVLRAGREVEDGIVTFLRSQEQALKLQETEKDAKTVVRVIGEQRKLGAKVDINREFVTTNFLVTQQDKLAQSRGDIALGLIQMYRALGGGWEIRLENHVPVARPEKIPQPDEMGAASKYPIERVSGTGQPRGPIWAYGKDAAQPQSRAVLMAPEEVVRPDVRGTHLDFLP
jgi:outer membrane protein TolC